MKDTFKLLSTNKKRHWSKLQEFCSSKGNFKTLRNVNDNPSYTEKISSPILFIKDLIIIEENHPDFWQNKYINIFKMELMGEKIRSVLPMEDHPVLSYPQSTPLKNFLLHLS